MVPRWLPSLPGPCPCRFWSIGKEHEPLSQNFHGIHSDQTSLITFPVPSPNQSLSREGEALIGTGPATCPTPRPAAVTSEPCGLRGWERGRSPDKNCYMREWMFVRQMVPAADVARVCQRATTQTSRRGRSQGGGSGEQTGSECERPGVPWCRGGGEI